MRTTAYDSLFRDERAPQRCLEWARVWICSHPQVADAVLVEGSVGQYGHAWIEAGGMQHDFHGSEPIASWYLQPNVHVNGRWTLAELLARAHRLGLAIQGDGTLLKVGPDQDGAVSL